jgi:hypothetical protein
MTLLDPRVEVCSGHTKLLAFAVSWSALEPPQAGAHRSKTCASKLHLFGSVVFLRNFSSVQTYPPDILYGTPFRICSINATLFTDSAQILVTTSHNCQELLAARENMREPG